MKNKWKNRLILLITIIFAASMMYFSLCWYSSFQSLTATEFSLKNDWWLDVAKNNKNDKGTLDGSQLSDLVTAFLYMPIQTALAFLVFITAIFNYLALRKQITDAEKNQQISKFLETISIVDEKLACDIESLENEIFKGSLDVQQNDIGKVAEFVRYLDENLPDDMYKDFSKTYFPDGNYIFPKTEPIGLYTDYFTKLSKIDGHLGSSYGGTASSSIRLLLMTIPENEFRSGTAENFYEILFNYLYSKLNHRTVDSRITFFKLAYSHFALTGYFDARVVSFVSYCLTKISNSIQSTNDGEFFEKLFYRMTSSDNFLFSTAMKNNFKVNLLGGDRIEICISNKYTRICRMHPQSKINYAEVTHLDVFNSIQDGFYVNGVIFIGKK
jgi:hypothetical protein